MHPPQSKDSRFNAQGQDVLRIRSDIRLRGQETLERAREHDAGTSETALSLLHRSLAEPGAAPPYSMPSSRFNRAGSNGEELKTRPSKSNVGTRRLPPLTLMTNSTASGASSMLISSNSTPWRFKNCLARQQSEHHRVVYMRILRPRRSRGATAVAQVCEWPFGSCIEALLPLFQKPIILNPPRTSAGANS